MFKKGDAVTYIAPWNGVGRYFYWHAVVTRTNGKFMSLACAKSGQDMGPYFNREHGSFMHLGTVDASGTFVRMPDETAHAIALGASDRYIESRRISIAHALADKDVDPELGAAWRDSMLADLMALNDARPLAFKKAY